MKRSHKIMLYKLSCLLFALVLMFLPHRGQPYSDIRVLATVLGVDGGEGNVSVSAQLAVPVAQNGDGKASTVARATGGSLPEALENLEIGLGRRIDYGHLSTVAIGEGALIDDIYNYMSYLLSSGKMGPGAFLVYCSKSQAGDFIEEAQQMGESSDAELANFISYSKRANHVATTTALKFLQTLNSSSHAATMPCVQLEDEDEKSNSGSGEQSGQSGGGQGGSQQQDEQSSSGSSGQSGQSGGGENKKKKLVAVDAVAAFGGDIKAATILDELTTRGVVWQDPNSDFGLVELRDVLIDGEEVPSVSARLTGKKVSRSAKIENGENVLSYKIKIKLRLDDSRICGNPLFYDKWKNALEEEFGSVVQSNLMRSVEVSKEMNLDFLGIRESFRKYCRKGYDNFELSSVVVNTDISVTIQT